MKRFFSFVFYFALCLSLVACGSGGGEADVDEPFILEGNYYTGYFSDKNAPHYPYSITVKFSSDGIVEWVDDNTIGSKSPRDLHKYYGIFELDGRKLIVTLSGEESVVCVVHDDGDSITIGGEKFNNTLPKYIYDDVLDMFEN